ncbi:MULTISPECIES: LuxR C-terminal-related transcriptional regulator [Serratia]|jgi:fimbrial protein FimW|uniref:Transcriptional activator protein BglJ n=1 Tax=Serratia ficaria TaxID=61651 RepID=A0A240CFK7_SERFI|nr:MULTISPECIES: LuxR C-terminal-related transcriptional regulator [Serratia]REF42339.1 fimbrial protein FimW [Serratia ficaria]CAI0960300.1 Transcriptional activator protein BglJ [Serratia ficaria]CAI0987268.1 Transcriptional activator protein BglJ [Serratia ficaria]CAI1131847.1 Transcriptional activator protein BglJ [Serratia ficaria]CAI1153773.1 Transcriptional activator protein BglJ [Serratia ficaria]
MPDIRFTLFDGDNFYQQGLRSLLQDYLHALNECHRLYPQLAPLESQRLEGVEVVFRTLEDRWGCACCYQSPYQTPRHRQMTVLILDDHAPRHWQAHPALFSIHRRDSVYAVRNKLQMALERFCQQPWVALHAAGLWKCQQCRIAALSSCEKKVLRLMSTGMSACSIAGMLQRSQKTISAHKRSAMRKLNVRKSSELNKMLLNQMGLN